VLPVLKQMTPPSPPTIVVEAEVKTVGMLTHMDEGFGKCAMCSADPELR
jgi:hypothetical protein